MGIKEVLNAAKDALATPAAKEAAAKEAAEKEAAAKQAAAKEAAAKQAAAREAAAKAAAAKAAAEKAAAEKGIDELARQVIRGDWGNGQERKDRLTAAGHNYSVIQDRVNELLKTGGVSGGKSVEELAREVIRGDWGNGQERKDRLTAAGYDYGAVQSKVNQLLK